jgi:hypothetical protein
LDDFVFAVDDEDEGADIERASVSGMRRSHLFPFTSIYSKSLASVSESPYTMTIAQSL